MSQNSRRAAYAEYADRCKENLDHVRLIYVEVALTLSLGEGESAESLAELLGSWRDPVQDLVTCESAVVAEGPERVADSASGASRALARFGTVVLESIESGDAVRAQKVQVAKETYGVTYKAYLDFLYDAAECLGDEEFLRIRS
ncbi:hypothetical protein [Streptomyces anulatus]|uniref:hypothetical protein n=1 Tax=Streptomyces anulatus TaxID=1892 RepID=UPI0033D06C49|nr:hypothetical protein OG536_17830 [Streptomyces anulatus]